MEPLTGINVYGWALIASVLLGLLLALSSLWPIGGSLRFSRVAIIPLICGLLIGCVPVLLHGNALLRAFSLVFRTPAAMAVALVILAFAGLVDFLLRRW